MLPKILGMLPQGSLWEIKGKYEEFKIILFIIFHMVLEIFNN